MQRGAGERCHGFTSDDGEYAHCSREDFAGALEQEGAGTYAHRLRGPCRCGAQHGADLRVVANDNEIEATYPYTDESGALLFEVVRKTGKRFLQRRPDGAGGWEWKTSGVRRVLYKLPELVNDDADHAVYVVEGEKDADTLARLGYLATCNPCGAGKWSLVAEHARQVLDGRDVIVVADADDPGRRHAAEIVAALAGAVRSIRTVEAPEPHKDVSALVTAGGGVDQLVPRQSDTKSDERPALAVIPTIGLREIAKPLDPIAWTIEGLGLAPGASACVAGYGFSAKTISMQSAELSVVTGGNVWGEWPARRGRVLHLDYEQGRRLTVERYQRLARAMGIDLAALDDDALRLAVLPQIYLDSPNAADIYASTMDGFSLTVVDSLRAATPSAEENSSEIRRHIDVLTRACEKTGGSAVFIHHAKKPSGDATGGAKMAIRGSSAIFDACASVFVFDGQKSGPTLVSHEKDRIRGVTIPDFALQVSDVPVGDDARGGVVVQHVDRDQIIAAADEAEWQRADERRQKIMRAIAGGDVKASASAVWNVVRGNRGQTLAAVRDLLGEGAIKKVGECYRVA